MIFTSKDGLSNLWSDWHVSHGSQFMTNTVSLTQCTLKLVNLTL